MTDLGDLGIDARSTEPAKRARPVRALGLLVCLATGIALVCVCGAWMVWALVVAPQFGPRPTADGSRCDWLGACTSLSEKALAKDLDLVLPAGSRILVSGRSSAGLFGPSQITYWLVCTGTPAAVVAEAHGAGYVDQPVGDVVDGNFAPKSVSAKVGVVSKWMQRRGVGNWKQVIVGGHCSGGTRLLLNWYRG